jgi:hypothetical protein
MTGRPHSSPRRHHHNQPADSDETWRNERARMLLTTADVDLFAGIIRPVIGLIATLRIAGHDRPLDVHLDAVSAGDHSASPQLGFRRLDASLQPVGEAEQVAVDTIAHLHLW